MQKRLTRRLEFCFWHDYEPLYRRDVDWGWIDYSIIGLDFEWANYCPRIEVCVSILGLHFELDWWRGPEPERWGNNTSLKQRGDDD